MASRENQGLQIALILFVMITVVLAVTTYVYYRKSEEMFKKAQAASNAQKTADDAASKANFKSQGLVYIIQGGPDDLDSIPVDPGDEEFAKIKAQYLKDIEAYGAGLEDEDKNYVSLPGNLISNIIKKNDEILTTAKREADLRAERQVLIDREKKAIEDTLVEQNRARDELAAERAKFDKERDQFVAAQSKWNTDLTAQKDAFNNLETESKKNIEESKNEISDLKKLQEGLKLRIASERDASTFRIPDGRITWVNQRTQTVWISVGLADGLRRQTTFSVYDHDENGIETEAIKGTIEVTKLIDQHLSEAIIRSDFTKNPILPGDVIFSPAWRPGRKLGFALAGTLDVDNDGNSDREVIRNLITMNGGMIHAELHDDGNMEGKLTESTRYILIGKKPNQDAGVSDALKAYGAMIKEANDRGIEELQLDQFLSLMGWKGEVRSVNLGRGARSEDFLPKLGSGGRPQSTGQTSGAFRDREPPGGGKASDAFRNRFNK